MQFLYYLSANAINLVSMMKTLNYRVLENAAICRDVEVYGALISSEKKFVVCTKNMLARGAGNSKFDETVYHESVHVVHACIGGPIGIPKAKMKLNPYSQEVLEYYRPHMTDKNEYTEEYEAYWLEDKPQLVTSYLKKHCF